MSPLELNRPFYAMHALIGALAVAGLGALATHQWRVQSPEPRLFSSHQAMRAWSEAKEPRLAPDCEQWQRQVYAADDGESIEPALNACAQALRQAVEQDLAAGLWERANHRLRAWERWMQGVAQEEFRPNPARLRDVYRVVIEMGNHWAQHPQRWPGWQPPMVVWPAQWARWSHRVGGRRHVPIGEALPGVYAATTNTDAAVMLLLGAQMDLWLQARQRWWALRLDADPVRFGEQTQAGGRVVWTEYGVQAQLDALPGPRMSGVLIPGWDRTWRLFPNP